MIRGSCLCGSVRFEIDRAEGPFELCHCTRCRKVSGSAFFSGLYVDRQDLRLVSGRERVQSFEAPILRNPPAYRVCFCGRCGSPLPDVLGDSPQVEIPAGLLDDAPGIAPDKHIFVEVKSPWFHIGDDLPQLTRQQIYDHRAALGED